MLAELLFPEITETPDDILKKYPKRPENITITRMAPSPTGFLHIGAIYSTLLDQIFAKKDNGIFYLRIEDTDQKREIEGAAEKFVDIFKKFGINFDEGPIGPNYEEVGEYGPYTQSKREYIYKVFIKDLIKKGLAYPCFMSEEEIENIRSIQEASKVPTGIYGEFSYWRNASFEEVKKMLDDKKEFVIRFKSPGEITKKIEVFDEIKGKVTIGENILDIVIMKKDGIPTYHFAHLIDDHLMGTNLVIRSDEWFASLPLHNQLFDAMGWNYPKYAHYGPMVKMDGESKRKISKRKDVEADIEYYFRDGYLIEGIIDFLCNMINSGYEDWRKENPNSSYLDFDFKIEKVPTSGALVDLQKLSFVNGKIIANMDINELYEKLSKYLETYDNDFFVNTFSKFPLEYNKKIILELNKRLTKFSEFKELTTFFYNDFEVTSHLDKGGLEGGLKNLLVNPKMKIENIDIAKKGLQLALDILSAKKEDFNSIDEVKELFVQEIQKNEMKNGQVLWPVRVALSGEEFSPGALELIFILGTKKSTQRIENILQKI